MTQRACKPCYFTNGQNVGFRLNYMNTEGLLTDPAITMQFNAPSLILGICNTGAGGGPSNLNVATTLHQTNFGFTFFEDMLNEFAQANAFGASNDGAFTYAPIPGAVNFSQYFLNVIQPGNPIGILTSKFAGAIVSTFWDAVQDVGAHYWSLMPQLLLEPLRKNSDLRLWSAPGIYTLNTANAWVTNAPGQDFASAFNDINLGSSEQLTFLILEQYTIQ